jgi:hypothetical protein
MDHSLLKGNMEFVANELVDASVFRSSVTIGKRATEGEWQRFPVVSRPPYFCEDEAARFKLNAKVIGSIHNLGYATKHGKRSEMVMSEITCT